MELNEVTCLKQQSNTLVLSTGIVSYWLWPNPRHSTAHGKIVAPLTRKFDHCYWFYEIAIDFMVYPPKNIQKFHQLPQGRRTSGSVRCTSLTRLMVARSIAAALFGRSGFLLAGFRHVEPSPSQGVWATRTPGSPKALLAKKRERERDQNIELNVSLQEQAWESSYGPCLVRSFLTAKDFQKLGETRTAL